MSGRTPKHSKISTDDRNREHKKDPFRALRKKPGVKLRSWTRRRRP